MAEAEAARIAVIYADTDDAVPGSFADMLGGIEHVPGVEIVRLRLSDAPEMQVAQLLMAANLTGAPLRLAAAGGSIGPIAVLYPDIGEPYRSVFSKIIEGIEDKAKARVTSYAVGNGFDPQAVSGELKRQDIRVVIALGRNGLKAASALDKDIGVVAGGIVTVPDETRGNAFLSLAPDPALLFSRLKAVAPKTQRVHVVYDSRQNAWLIKLAREAARQQGLDLIVQEAADLKSALVVYQNIFNNADPKRDALWLPQDTSTVDETLVLPLVLQESWSRGMVVFSSNVSHVRRGALFALYPNNVELGRNLAVSALGMSAGNSSGRNVLPLRDVLTAFNTRTASHLGLERASNLSQGFDLLFPEQ